MSATKQRKPATPRKRCHCGTHQMPDLCESKEQAWRKSLGDLRDWVQFICPNCERRGPSIPTETTPYEAQRDAAQAWDQKMMDHTPMHGIGD